MTCRGLCVLEEMIDEVQLEARFCTDPEDSMLCLAKRDALSELNKRLRHSKVDVRWARMRPTIVVSSVVDCEFGNSPI